MDWGTANARARGLATHLLSREGLLHAAGAGTWSAAARSLVGSGFPASERDLVSREEFDRAAGRIAAGRLGLLGRWLGDQRGALAVIYEDEDRRSVRRLLRGAVQGVSPDARLLGLIPTPDLPEQLLLRLSRASSSDHLVLLLVRSGHPAGRALTSATGSKRDHQAPGLWRSDVALGRLFATRATRAARRAGSRVRQFVALLIDLENAWSLLARPDWGAEVTPDALFLDGGRALDHDAFARLAALGGSPDAMGRELSKRFASTPLAGMFADPPGAAHLEDRAAAALIAWQRAEARKDPLSAARVLEVLLRIRGEAHDVRLVVFAVDLGAPPQTIEPSLVSAA